MISITTIKKDRDLKVILSCTLLSILIFAIDTLIPLGVAGGVPYISVVLLSLWSKKKKLPLVFAVCSSMLTIIAYFTSPSGGELWKVLFNRGLALFAIWTTAILAQQRIKIAEEREAALSDLKILKGLLPMCANCKKIRDDQGDWNQMEFYIEHHTEAQFSHGLCPQCGDELYGGQEWYEISKLNKNKTKGPE